MKKIRIKATAVTVLILIVLALLVWEIAPLIPLLASIVGWAMLLAAAAGIGYFVYMVALDFFSDEEEDYDGA